MVGVCGEDGGKGMGHSTKRGGGVRRHVVHKRFV